MEGPDEGEIGSTIGLIAEGEKHVGVIINFDDVNEQVTIRREDGVEITGSYNYAYTNLERMMESKPRSNWKPVPDPSFRDVALWVGGIVTVAFAFLLFLTVISFGAILTQIDSANWVETQGNVEDAYEGEDCSSDSEGSTSCSYYTSVTVTYKYDGKKYATQDYTMLSEDWLKDPDHWLEKGNVTVYVNPEQPSQAVHVQGWNGVLEELSVFFFFTGLILGGYLFLFVPAWFVYAKIQRLYGIEAGQSDWTILLGEKQTDIETDETRNDDVEPKTEDTPPEPKKGEEPSQQDTFW